MIALTVRKKFSKYVFVENILQFTNSEHHFIIRFNLPMLKQNISAK